MDPALRQEIEELYQRVAARVDQSQPRCEMSGRCCDFPTSEHELWASDVEVEFAVAAAGERVPAADSGLCPWHVDGLCQLRDGRPLGCRIYFCDPSWEAEMPAVYETFHRELQQLHERYGRRYAYRSFVEAVSAARAEREA